MNLLEHFTLQHVQVSVLKSELVRVSREAGMHDAKVELNLAPRVLEPTEQTRFPAYQVSARLNCESSMNDEDSPAFNATVGIEAVYQQISGEPVDINVFTSHHAVLARQLYPLLQQEMRGLLSRMGLSQIQLPFDLASAQPEVDRPPVVVSSSLH
jgi:hypothetical protein